MVKHPWPLLEISLSDFCRLATLNMITYLPTYLQKQSVRLLLLLPGERKIRLIEYLKGIEKAT